MIEWSILAIIILLLAAAIFVTIKYSKNKSKKGPDYYAFFLIGIIWLAIGIPFNNVPLWALGLVFFIVGLANKKKWKSNKVKWKDLDKKEKKL